MRCKTENANRDGMATFTDVFEREETKYRLNGAQYAALRAALSGRMLPDSYGSSFVSSVYYDTLRRDLITRSLEKPLYKEKLRLRAYGNPGPPAGNARVFLEIKKKFDGIVYKRRVALSCNAARACLEGVPYEQACKAFPLSDPMEQAESLAERSLQIAREIDALVQRHRPLSASMAVVCKRTAFVPAPACPLSNAPSSFDSAQRDGAGEPSSCAFEDMRVPSALRITFDEEISFCDLRTRTSGLHTRRLLLEGDVVMEVKSSAPFPLWLARALSECEAYPSSFSKYGEAYRCIAQPSVPKETRVAAVSPNAPARFRRASGSPASMLSAGSFPRIRVEEEAAPSL